MHEGKLSLKCVRSPGTEIDTEQYDLSGFTGTATTQTAKTPSDESSKPCGFSVWLFLNNVYYF